MDKPILKYVYNGRGHEDLILSLPNYERVADTYYFALDSGIRAGDESFEKVRTIIASLLAQWNNAVSSRESVVFLPYDFSDEYTGCLRVLIEDKVVHVTPGFSKREGWSFSPSDISGYVHSVSDFRTDGPSISFSREGWIDRVMEAAMLLSSLET